MKRRRICCFFFFQIPTGGTKPPLVMHWGGVDGWKEDRQRASSAIHRAALATLIIDMAGTGESPVLYGDPAAERSYSAWIDHLTGRSDNAGRWDAGGGGGFGGVF